MKNNSIGDFFRKKLNEDSISEDWSNLDTEVDEQVLRRILYSGNSKSNKWKNSIVQIGVGVLFLLICGYAWHLNEELKIVKKELVDVTSPSEIKQSQMLNQFGESHNIFADQKNEKKDPLFETKNFQQFKRQLIHDKIELEQQLMSFQLAAKQIEAEASHSKDSLNEIIDRLKYRLARDQYLDAKMRDDDLLSNRPLKPLELPLLDDFLKIRHLDRATLNQIDPTSTTKYSIAYEHILQSWNVPFTRSFDTHRLVSGGSQNDFVLSHSNGLIFSFSPEKHWWIKSGIRFLNLDIKNTQHLALAYSSRNEALEPNGDINSTISTKLNTPFFTAKNSLEIQFQQTRLPEEESLMEYRSTDHLSISMWQMPFGLARYIPVSKSLIFIHGGLQLNAIQINDYTFQTTVLDDEQNTLQILKANTDVQQLNNRIFLGAFGEFGIQRSFYQSWYLKTAISYSYHFLKNNDHQIAAQAKTSSAIMLGLGYQF